MNLITGIYVSKLSLSSDIPEQELHFFRAGLLDSRITNQNAQQKPFISFAIKDLGVKEVMNLTWERADFDLNL